ncbi:flagellar filament capping protein FliD, partial [Delftia lacustris]|uniref:flagellar filament capping protein FliD n=2 Tax=Comamonadaceae TaxID=80864 RepID=UPI0009E1CCCD
QPCSRMAAFFPFAGEIRKSAQVFADPAVKQAWVPETVPSTKRMLARSRAAFRAFDVPAFVQNRRYSLAWACPSCAVKEHEMAISSIGIGSGLKVTEIISQMVDLAKKPLDGLQTKAKTIDAQISTYSKIKSLTSTLADAAAKLTRDSGWNAMTVKSSNTAVSMTVTGITSPSVYDIGVGQLSRAQTSVSDARVVDSKLGTAGTLTIAQGTKSWGIDYTASDTLTTLAAKINDKGAGVKAAVMRDASGNERLMLTSKETGEKSAFTTTGLNFTIPPGQSAQNAKITINGVEQVSETDNFDNILPGLKISVNEITTAGKDARVSIASDKEAIKKNLQEFIDAYNAVNELLSSSTKSMRSVDGKVTASTNPDNESEGVLQADSSTVNLQNALRSLTTGTASNASGAFTRLAQVGIQMQQGGALKITDTTKLDKALESPDAIKSLFAAKSSSDGTGGGIAVNFKKFTDELLSYDGTLNSKSDSLKKRSTANLDEQKKVNQNAATLEARMTRQYTALDKQMASISALSTYMTQQVASWNKSSS